MKLDKDDFTLLNYLHSSHREPLTKIAKATNLTRSQVEYKLEGYIKTGLIRKFLTMFNYSALGYDCYVTLFIKFEKFIFKEGFVKKLKENPKIISWGECFGKYDIYLNLIFKDETELSEYITELVSDEKNLVLDYLLSKPNLAESYTLKIFGRKEIKTIQSNFKNQNKIILESYEIEIIKLLEKNNKLKIVDIANKLKISSELVIYYLKRIDEKKVITGTKAVFDVGKMGYQYSVILIHVKNLSKETKEKIINFSKKHKLIDFMSYSIMKPNFIIQVYHKDIEELKRTITEIKELLNEQIFEIDIILMNLEEEINTLPFLK